MYIQLIRLTCLFSASSTLRVTSIFPSLCQKVSKGDVCRQLTWFQSTSSHPWRPNRGDSPRWTCERVTGKQEHTDVCYTTYPCVCVWGCEWWASVTFTLLIVSWSTGMDLSQHTKALASGSEFVCETSESSVMDRDRSLSDRLVHCTADVRTRQKHLALLPENCRVIFQTWVRCELIIWLNWRSTPLTQTSQAEIHSLKLRCGSTLATQLESWDSPSILIIQTNLGHFHKFLSSCS